MPDIQCRLTISPEEFQRLYQGTARDVLATSVDGRRVRFPAWILQPYVTRNGIHGHFVIRCDENHRFLGIEKID